MTAGIPLMTGKNPDNFVDGVDGVTHTRLGEKIPHREDKNRLAPTAAGEEKPKKRAESRAALNRLLTT